MLRSVFRALCSLAPNVMCVVHGCWGCCARCARHDTCGPQPNHNTLALCFFFRAGGALVLGVHWQGGRSTKLGQPTGCSSLTSKLLGLPGAAVNP